VVVIKKTIKEIIEYRVNEGCYIIYDNKGDFYVVYGTSYKLITGGSLYDIIMSFVKEKTGWKYTEKHIRLNKRSDSQSWIYLNSENEDEVIDVDDLYIDGIKQK
jgi:hypothetical protein